MRNRTIKIGESRRKRRIRKNRRRFILFITLLSLSISFLIFYKWEKIDIKFYKRLGISVKNNESETVDKDKDKEKDKEKQEDIADNNTDTDNNADTDTDNNTNNNTDADTDNINLDNSGYITLENDINADDASKVLPETMYKWNFYREDGKKIAYLTFDDGPSIYSTEKILDILKLNDVKATFFALGSSIDNNNKSGEILKRIAKEGHAIGSHGYSHNYSILYPNRTVDVNAFINDFEKNDKLLKSILGKDFSTRLIRLPGGHSSWKGTEELDKVLKQKNIWQVDWNSLNGDAEGRDFPVEVLLNKLKKTVADQDVAIILMHDTDNKKGTVECLQSAIDYLKSQGFEFRTLK